MTHFGSLKNFRYGAVLGDSAVFGNYIVGEFGNCRRNRSRQCGQPCLMQNKTDVALQCMNVSCSLEDQSIG